MGILHAAVDLGAGSGRVLIGGLSPQGVVLEEVHRFSYAPRPANGYLRWDFAALLEGVRTGLVRAGAFAARERLALRSVGVDSWGVDYGFVDRDGHLVEEPICYRDPRTESMMARAFARIGRESLFQKTGIQFLPLNTIFQLLAHVESGLPPAAARLLMIPDLCHQSLCGSTSGELTNASTTQLLNVETGEWDSEVCERLGLPRHLLPPLLPPGTELGPLRANLRVESGLRAATVVQPATHDTASAVAGTPLRPEWAFISSGTWSLVGVERQTPLVDTSVRAANFTNERGAGGTFRLLKNVAGLWILDCCIREWKSAGHEIDLPRLLQSAAALDGQRAIVDPDAPRFFNPPSMVKELCAALNETSRPAPTEPAALTRIILDSLAHRYASVVRTIERLTGDRIQGIHIVGGGSRNAYVNQATADATGLPVVSGPVEATSLGNILVQAVALGVTTLSEGREWIAQAFAPQRFEPAGTSSSATSTARSDG